jgi:hypothetical protein
MAITHLRTNTSVNDRIKGYFPSVAKEKGKFINFNLHPEISYIGINTFKDSLLEKKYIANEGLLTNGSSYSKLYIFPSFISSFLEKIKWQEDGKLFLSFSKPIEDYLVAELTEINPTKFTSRKTGRAMQLFFKFDSLGAIADVLYSGCIYN